MSDDLQSENVSNEAELADEQFVSEADDNNELVDESENSSEQEKEAKPQDEEPDYKSMHAERAFELRREKREREELERKLQELQKPVTNEQEPAIPPTPDPWDDDFEAKLKARDEALLKQAEFRAQERIRQQQTEQQEQAMLQKQQQQLVEAVTKYSERATALGITEDELVKAGTRLSGMFSKDVEGYILKTEKGPLMTKYLASNPIEAEKIAQMSTADAVEYMVTQIKPRAEQFGVKKVTQAPEPVDTLSGNGAPPFEGPEGGQFY